MKGQVAGMDPPGTRILVAMSGGVDSSVTAFLLQQAGYDVVGVTMDLWPSRGEEEDARHGGCCGLGAAEDARRVARRLGIPHYTLDLRQDFQDTVVRDFSRAYAQGRTPNPCVACNRFIKFDALLTKALELDCPLVATGHYARVLPAPEGGVGLYVAEDPQKDQSYVLYPVRREALSRIRLPLGGLWKTRVRELAFQAGLAVWNKPDSVEICFVGGDYRRFLRETAPEVARPGPIVDTQGRELGTHPGIAFFTVGQRRGLGVASRDGEPYYVVAIDPDRQAVVVGRREEAFARSLAVEEVNWLAPPAEAGQEVQVRVRAHGPLTPATVERVADGGAQVWLRLHQPVFAPAPGQAAVFYQEGRVLGGGRLAPLRWQAAA
jgi:tRNA-specific 2-thiouridylase